jgi:hypothetical protein
MKILQKSATTLISILLWASIATAQDLSRYRTFSLGASIDSVSRQVGERPNEISVIHQSPVLLQELTWWPVATSGTGSRAEAVEQVKFSFCNRALYKIVATYQETATKGLTPEDMIQAVSATYGAATRPAADPDGPTPPSYRRADAQLGRWENTRDSVALSYSPLSDSFQLTLVATDLNAQAEAGTAEAVKQETESAPQRETARVKKEADDLAAMREENLKSFRP